jgi:hypothetical protein
MHVLFRFVRSTVNHRSGRFSMCSSVTELEIGKRVIQISGLVYINSERVGCGSAQRRKKPEIKAGAHVSGHGRLFRCDCRPLRGLPCCFYFVDLGLAPQAFFLPPAPQARFVYRGRLEHVAQCELHEASGFGFAEGRLRAREVSESERRRSTRNKRIDGANT